MKEIAIPNEGRLLLRGTEVAEALGCSRALAYRLMSSGGLPVVRVGSKSIRVPRAGLLRWIEERTEQPEAR